MEDQQVLVDIIMPTFNAAPWLDDFMLSLLRQDFHDWCLIVRDDASGDDTLEQLAGWRARIGDRMVILPEDGKGNLGACGNTSAVLSASQAPWKMLADPDDVWLDGKMTQMVEAIRQAEKASGTETPIAICSDAIVVDSSLNTVNSSWWKSTWATPRAGLRARTAAMENFALSSTMIFNRALGDLAGPIPNSARYQDWWIAFVAAAFGRLLAVPQATILYRQHDKNLSGAIESATLFSALRVVLRKRADMQKRLRAEIVGNAAQARTFLERFGGTLPPAESAAIAAVARLPDQSPVTARIGIFQHGLWLSTIARNVRLMALL